MCESRADLEAAVALLDRAKHAALEVLVERGISIGRMIERGDRENYLNAPSIWAAADAYATSRHASALVFEALLDRSTL